MSHLLIWQRVNHFEDSKQLTRKDLLKKNIQRYVDIGHKLSAEFEIMPKTFLLPHEYTQFIQSYTFYENMKKEEIKTIGTTQLHNYWILKPVGLSRGRGISLITDINDITYSQASVIQKYIERPLCLHGYKFDLRIYVVVTSFHPLEAFIYRDGFARVSTQEYSLNSNDAQNKFIHLTNSSIQKYNMNDVKSNNPISEHSEENKNEESSDVGGSKISLLGNNGLWNRLKLFGINVDQVWEDMCLCIVKSLVMVDEKIAYQPCCFELFGYDILIDSNLRPWLLEVNASPSLARENHLDHRVKNALIHDIIQLLDIAAYDREALAKILRKRLQSITSKKRYLYGSNDTELEQDLRSILGDYRPRRFGEPPKHLGQFECLCPNTKNYDTVLKLKKKIMKPLNEEG
jgi:tubulin polyglutamylase TTLL5